MKNATELNTFLQVLKKSPCVLFGAGVYGRRVANILHEQGITVDCFCDNEKTGIDETTNLNIISFDTLISNYTNANIVICIRTKDKADAVLFQLLNSRIRHERIYSLYKIYEFFNNRDFEWEFSREREFEWNITKDEIHKMSEWLDENDSSVLDLGAGAQHLKDFLLPNIKYIPVDYKKRRENVIVCDFNQNPFFPNIRADVCFISEVIQYIKSPEMFLKNVCNAAHKKILICHTKPDSFAMGFLGAANNLTTEEIEDYICAEGFELIEKLSWEDKNFLLFFIKKERN